MDFTGYPPPIPAIEGTSWQIFGDGEIVPGTTERLQEFLKDHDVPFPSNLHLNSDGGNLAESIKLGRFIRHSQLCTYVARPGSKPFETRPGECLSACAMAFLGGLYRFSHKGSLYGVHRFYAQENGSIDSDSAQIISAALVEYIQSMGINPNLFKLTAQAGADEIRLLSETEQLSLNVVNNGQGPTAWTIESHDGWMYLRGWRDTWRGLNKFIIGCTNRGVLLDVLYNAERRGEDIIQFPVHWLIINGEYPKPTIIPIDKFLLKRQELDSNDVINSGYLLPGYIVKMIQNADSVGIAMKPSTDSPIFMGFYGMKFAGAVDQLRGLLNTCPKR